MTGTPSARHRTRPATSAPTASGNSSCSTASTRAAKLFGLFPRKGTIQPGSDADLVVYDPGYRGTISVKTQLMNVDYNPFEGMAIEGRPSAVTARGQVAARDGKFVGQVGRGKFLEREPSHF